MYVKKVTSGTCAGCKSALRNASDYGHSTHKTRERFCQVIGKVSHDMFLRPIPNSGLWWVAPCWASFWPVQSVVGVT